MEASAHQLAQKLLMEKGEGNKSSSSKGASTGHPAHQSHQSTAMSWSRARAQYKLCRAMMHTQGVEQGDLAQ